MSRNLGIFNRGESLVKSQQTYDVYSFIANKPYSERQKHVTQQTPKGDHKDWLQRFAAKGETRTGDLSDSTVRELVKLLVKAVASIPILVVYVGPRKIAQIIQPILQKVLHLIPHLLQQNLNQLQVQFLRFKPAIVKLQVFIQSINSKLKSTVEQMAQFFANTQQYLSKRMISLVDYLKDAASRFTWKLVPKKMIPDVKLGIENPFAHLMDQLKGKLGLLGRVFMRQLSHVLEDIRLELRDGLSFLKRVASSLSGTLGMVKNTGAKAASLASKAGDALAQELARIKEALVQPWKKLQKKAKEIVPEMTQKMQQIPEMVTMKIQTFMLPAINFLASMNQVIRNHQEKLAVSIKSRIRDFNQRFQRFAQKFHECIDWLNQAGKALFAKMWNPTLFYRIHNWLLHVLRKLVALVALVGKRVVVGVGRFIHSLRKRMDAALRILICYGLKALKSIPYFLYKLIDWAFGRPGILVLMGVKWCFNYLQRGIKIFIQISREVVFELVKNV